MGSLFFKAPQSFYEGPLVSPLISEVPREIWQNHICVSLDSKSLAALRCTCSYFRKQLLFSPPLWLQWVPYHELGEVEEKYRELNWGKKFTEIYGVYFIEGDFIEDDVVNPLFPSVLPPPMPPISADVFQKLPRSLQALDFSMYMNMKDFKTEYIKYFPRSIKTIYFRYPSVNDISEECLKHLYSLFPDLMIHFGYRDEDSSYSVLYYACHKGYHNIVDFLLENHKEEVQQTINKRIGYHKFTPLTVACERMYPVILESLLKYGADPNITDLQGMTPLMRSVINGDSEFVSMLLRYGADKKIRTDKNGKEITVLDLARDVNSDKKIIEMLEH